MPYISMEDRGDDYDAITPKNGGELNYEISNLIGAYLYFKGLSYQNISDVLGALEGAKLEFVRRVVNPYEEIKRKENGDLVYYRVFDNLGDE